MLCKKKKNKDRFKINNSSFYEKPSICIEKTWTNIGQPVNSESEVAQSCPTLCNPMDCSPRNLPGKSTGVGCHFLLQGIFLTQGSNRVSRISGRGFTSEPPRKHRKNLDKHVNLLTVLISNYSLCPPWFLLSPSLSPSLFSLQPRGGSGFLLLLFSGSTICALLGSQQYHCLLSPES